MMFLAADGRLQPGFRFHPHDDELVMHYLRKKVLGMPLKPEVVAEVDIYQFHPENLRERACWKKDLCWYFFCAKKKRYGSGDRKNRTAESGYWKATGIDRIVKYRRRTVGKVKTLVFHQGKPPKGERTDWVMHEYRLEDSDWDNMNVPQDAYFLCKVFKKSGWGPRNGEQYGDPYMAEEWDEGSNNAPMIPIAVQDPSAPGLTNYAVTNGLVSVDACPSPTSEQVYSGAVSVSAIDQPSTPTPDVSNIASTSKGTILNYNDAADQVPIPILNPADIASTSEASVPNNDDDEIERFLFPPDADDGFAEIYDELEDLEDLGLGLSDLTTPLGGLP